MMVSPLAMRKTARALCAEISVIILCLLPFASIAYAQHNETTCSPIHWAPGQESAEVPLTSPSSHDHVLRMVPPGTPEVTGSAAMERYFLIVGAKNWTMGGDKYVSLGRSITSLERKTGLYNDGALSGKDYLTEVVDGDCVVKGNYIFPANRSRNVGMVIISTSEFPRYDLIDKPQRPTVLHKFILRKKRLHNRIIWYLSYISTQKLDRYYCLEEDYIRMVSKFAGCK